MRRTALCALLGASSCASAQYPRCPRPARLAQPYWKASKRKAAQRLELRSAYMSTPAAASPFASYMPLMTAEAASSRRGSMNAAYAEGGGPCTRAQVNMAARVVRLSKKMTRAARNSETSSHQPTGFKEISAIGKSARRDVSPGKVVATQLLVSRKPTTRRDTSQKIWKIKCVVVCRGVSWVFSAFWDSGFFLKCRGASWVFRAAPPG